MSERSSAAFAAGNDLGRTIARALRRGRHYFRTLHELDGLDDHDLRDLQIPRANVSRIAWDEACRRMDAARVAAAADARIATERTHGFHVWLLIGSGVVAAAQVGKAIISIPLIRSEMAVGFDLAALIVATFAALGAFFGLGAGVMVRRLGVRPALIGGMAAVALGNVVGALAPDESVLLAARIIEASVSSVPCSPFPACSRRSSFASGAIS